MKVYVVLCWDDWNDGNPSADVDKIFLSKQKAEEYAHDHDFDHSDLWFTVTEHEVIE